MKYEYPVLRAEPIKLHTTRGMQPGSTPIEIINTSYINRVIYWLFCFKVLSVCSFYFTTSVFLKCYFLYFY